MQGTINFQVTSFVFTSILWMFWLIAKIVLRNIKVMIFLNIEMIYDYPNAISFILD